MSHYTEVETKFTDAATLLWALCDVGYPTVEHHQVATNLYGYRGDKRPDLAHIILRREFVGEVSNDIGFRRGEDGVYRAIISGYDASYHNAAWMGRLSQRYAYRAVMARARAQGLTVTMDSTAQVQAGR